MTVFNPNNEEHTFKIIPRDYKEVNTSSLHTLQLYNEGTTEVTTYEEVTIYDVCNGYVYYTITKTFLEGESYQIKITDDLTNLIVYRGKAFATSKATQNYNINE